ncbi:head-tail joining protein [Undibacterium sp. Di27W]|uniref:head-tail joining protein n=1 Tax=Undibacterium sp. Di27W TaxID=3413036 RepID=UPI003BF11C57
MSDGADNWRLLVKENFKGLTDYAGAEVVFTGTDGVVHTARVMYSEPSVAVLSAMQISDDYAIEYDPDDLPGLKHRSRITVKNISFTVREITNQTDDGITYRATLQKD